MLRCVFGGGGEELGVEGDSDKNGRGGPWSCGSLPQHRVARLECLSSKGCCERYTAQCPAFLCAPSTSAYKAVEGQYRLQIP